MRGWTVLNYVDLLHLENERLSVLLTRYLGKQLLQLDNYALWRPNTPQITHKIYVSNKPISMPSASQETPFLYSAFTHLPFASDSLSLVLLPHTLELEKTPKLILKEAWRVLSPNGYLILLGSNPVSFLGLARLLASAQVLPRPEHLLALQTVCRWIHYLRGDICHIESFFFRPPLSGTVGQWFFRRLFWLEKISPWLFPYLGGLYLVIAQKRLQQWSGLNLAWQLPPILNNKTLAPNARITYDDSPTPSR